MFFKSNGNLKENVKEADTDTLYKIKSRITAREIIVTMQSGKKSKKTIYEKQAVFYIKKYADKEKSEREKEGEKALELVANHAQYNSATSY